MNIFGLQDNETVLSESYITNEFVSQFYQPKITLNNLLSYSLISDKPDLNQYVQVVNFFLQFFEQFDFK